MTIKMQGLLIFLPSRKQKLEFTNISLQGIHRKQDRWLGLTLPLYFYLNWPIMLYFVYSLQCIVHCTLGMIDIDRQLIISFWSQKLQKKGSRNIYQFYLRKLSRLRGQFNSTALVIDTFYFKYCSVLTQYQITFLSKKKYLQIFFMQFYATKNF